MDAPVELLTLINCSICHHRFDFNDRLPKLLNCQHFFCMSCLAAQMLDAEVELDCPSCGVRTALPVAQQAAILLLPEHNSLLYLIQQLPALNLSMPMLSSSSSNVLFPKQYADGSVESFLCSCSKYCLRHELLNSNWCHNCWRTMHNAQQLHSQRALILAARHAWLEPAPPGDSCKDVQQPQPQPNTLSHNNATAELFECDDYIRQSLELQLQDTETQSIQQTAALLQHQQQSPCLGQAPMREHRPPPHHRACTSNFETLQTPQQARRCHGSSVGHTPNDDAANLPGPSISALLRCPIVRRYPLYFLDMEMAGNNVGRILIEVRSDLAPRMAENFRALILHERGYGYRHCTVFQAWGNESIITGDFETQNGCGGHAALNKHHYFMPEKTGIASQRGTVGMRVDRKRHKSFVGSQFRMMLNEMHSFTAIFGFIVDGLRVVELIANTGDNKGRPVVRSIIKNCGVYDSDG